MSLPLNLENGILSSRNSHKRTGHEVEKERVFKTLKAERSVMRFSRLDKYNARNSQNV